MLINQDFSVDRSKYIGGSDIGAISLSIPIRGLDGKDGQRNQEA